MPSAIKIRCSLFISKIIQINGLRLGKLSDIRIETFASFPHAVKKNLRFRVVKRSWSKTFQIIIKCKAEGRFITFFKSYFIKFMHHSFERCFSLVAR
jgi:hypothetical protein